MASNSLGVRAAMFETAVEDADEAVGKGAQRLMVRVAAARWAA